jgi:multisubunit Na+/H+ antiporter MnhE subunit
MTLLAVFFDDRPAEWRLVPLAVYIPAIVIFVSWMLIRRKRSLAIVSLVVAAGAAYLILSPLQREVEYLAAIKHPYPDSVIWAYRFSALFPFAMIAAFYLTQKKEPIQPPQATRGKAPRV